jgi:predicted phage terminase large subunit-like protein
MRRSIDDNTWWAKYMGQPYARQGLLFHSDKLNYYNGVLPDCEPDRIVAACDVAWGGGDFLSMPICYYYGDTCYVADVVFNDGDKTVTQPLVVGRIMRHLPHVCQFEANNGGHEYAAAVDKALREKKIMLNISSRRAPSDVAKVARIIQHAPDIAGMVFLDAEHQSQEYREFMRWLCMFVTSGRNEHDDAPDSLAMVVESVSHNFGEVTVGKRVI